MLASGIREMKYLITVITDLVQKKREQRRESKQRYRLEQAEVFQSREEARRQHALILFKQRRKRIKQEQAKEQSGTQFGGILLIRN